MTKHAHIVTAALPFVNNLPHLGNIAGSHLPADIFARYLRLKGERVVFVGGSDEHGTASELAAHRRGVSPRSLCDELHLEHLKAYRWLGISYDCFIRTSDERHAQVARDLFRSLHERGYVVPRTLASPYCRGCRRGLADRFVSGICPSCAYGLANGDQCEGCGRPLEARELISPVCAFCGGRDISFEAREHLFLDYASLLSRLREWVANHPRLVRAARNLALALLDQGVKPRCISREIEWGIPIPLDGYRDKVLYVWFENVIGYISATRVACPEAELWSDPETKVHHFFGKDNTPFHLIYWPAALLADGRYVLPYELKALEYLTFEGSKFSKSRGTGIFADAVVASGIPADYWRFYLTLILPESRDSDFRLEDFRTRVNSDLIGNFGNLLQRSHALGVKLCAGWLRAPARRNARLEKQIDDLLEQALAAYAACELKRAFGAALELSALGNRHLSAEAPWRSGDTDPVAYALEICRLASLALAPILPHTRETVTELLGSRNEDFALDWHERRLGGSRRIFEPISEEQLERLRPR